YLRSRLSLMTDQFGGRMKPTNWSSSFASFARPCRLQCPPMVFRIQSRSDVVSYTHGYETSTNRRCRRSYVGLRTPTPKYGETSYFFSAWQQVAGIAFRHEI